MWGRTSRCGAARTSTGAPRETLALPSSAIDHRRGRAGLQLLDTSRRWARVAVPRPEGRMAPDLRFSFRPARPYLPCAPRKCPKVENSTAVCPPTRLLGVSGVQKSALPEESLITAFGAPCRRFFADPALRYGATMGWHSPGRALAHSGATALAMLRARRSSCLPRLQVLGRTARKQCLRAPRRVGGMGLAGTATRRPRPTTTKTHRPMRSIRRSRWCPSVRDGLRR